MHPIDVIAGLVTVIFGQASGAALRVLSGQKSPTKGGIRHNADILIDGHRENLNLGLPLDQ